MPCEKCLSLHAGAPDRRTVAANPEWLRISLAHCIGELPMEATRKQRLNCGCGLGGGFVPATAAKILSRGEAREHRMVSVEISVRVHPKNAPPTRRRSGRCADAQR
jgi:hypothetical protein